MVGNRCLVGRAVSTRPSYYVLDENRQPVPADVDSWAKRRKRVALTELSGGIRVSTVFLGLDHSFSDEGPPILFETLVFEGPLDGHMLRYATWAAAKIGHARIVDEVRAAIACAQKEQADG